MGWSLAGALPYRIQQVLCCGYIKMSSYGYPELFIWNAEASDMINKKEHINKICVGRNWKMMNFYFNFCFY